MLKQFDIPGPHKNLAGSGHPWCTIAKEDKIMWRMSKSDRKIIAFKQCDAWRNNDINT